MNFILAITLIVMLLVVFRLMRKKQPKLCLPNDLAGKNKDYVTSLLGPPKNAVVLVNGSQLLQWYCQGHHISIVFDREGNFVRRSDNKLNEQGM